MDLEITMENLRARRGAANSLVTLYLPPDRPVHATIEALRAEQAQAANIKSKITRRGVERALHRLIHLVQTAPSSNNGWVFAAGETAGQGGRAEFVDAIIEAPRRLSSYAYRCGNTFDLAPLERMLQPERCVALIAIDRRDVALGLWSGSDVELVYEDESQVPGKHHRGGQSAQRFERLTEQAALEWYRRVAQHVREALQPMTGKLDALLVGGPGMSKQAWLTTSNLNHELRALAQPPIDIGYAGVDGLRDLARHAAAWASQDALARQTRDLEVFFEAVAKEGRVEYGEPAVLEAVRSGRARRVLVARGHDEVVAAARAAGVEVIRVVEATESGRMFARAFGAGAFVHYLAG